MAKVSIIIPVYNAEEYLEKCLESVIEQTLQDIEIICIDDGSTDSSLQIAMDYQKQDGRIKVYHKENGGLVSARKKGVELAQGKYIGFVDSDDWVEEDMYEKLYKQASVYDADLVTSGCMLEGNYTTFLYDEAEEGIYREENLEELREKIIYDLERKAASLRASLCYKLFLKEKLNQAIKKIPDMISIAEDKMTLITFVLDCESVYVDKNVYYHYRINPNSMSHSQNNNYLIHVNSVYQYLLELYKHPKFTQEMKTQAEIYMMELLILGINTRLGFANKNMMRIDPYWVDKLPMGARIVLFGGGELGEKYRKHLKVREDIEYVGCVDTNNKLAVDGLEVEGLEKLSTWQYDYIVITIKNEQRAKEIKELLAEQVLPDKVLWFPQEDIIWRYVKGDGII